MSVTATSSNPTAEIQQNPPVGSEMAKEKDLLSPDDGGTSKKGRGLLSVPSRSSSQRNESSPTSTGLSGATVSDSRNSIGSRSKDSKGSFLGRPRNGSASSNRTGGETEPTTTPGNSQPNSPLTGTQKKKRGGLLSLFGCCGVPDSANTVDGDEENIHKVDKLPQRPATAKSPHTPQEQPGTKQLNEKDPHQNTTAAATHENQVPVEDTEDQITPAERENRESKQSVTPAVTVDPPSAQQSESHPLAGGKSAGDEDTAMPDVPQASQDSTVIASVSGTQTKQLPPPPPPPGPGPLVAVPTPPEAGPSAVEPQKWLLPPITSQFKGRKCLVLDLDETLVHSSFKVRSERCGKESMHR